MKIDMPPIASLHHVEKPTVHDAAEFRVVETAPRLQPSVKDSDRFAAALIENSSTLESRDVLVGDVSQFSRSMKVQELYTLFMGAQNANMTAAASKIRRQLRQQLETIMPHAEREDNGMSLIMDAAGNDPALAHVLIQAALQQVEQSPRYPAANPAPQPDFPAEKSNLERYVQLVQARYGNQVNAGLNTAKAFARATRDPKRRKTLRDEYYATVIGDQSPVRMIATLLNHSQAPGSHGEESFTAALNTLKAAIADDLVALRPSAKSSHLKTLMKGLATAARLGTLFNDCENILRCMNRVYRSPDALTAPMLLRELLTIGEQRVHAVAALVARMSGTMLKHQLIFLNALGPVIKTLEPCWKVDKNSKDPFASLRLLRNQLTAKERGLSSGSPVVALSGPGSATDPQRLLGSHAYDAMPAPGRSTEAAS